MKDVIKVGMPTLKDVDNNLNAQNTLKIKDI